MTRIVFKATVAKQYNINRLIKEMTRGLVAESKQIKKDFSKTTQTWDQPAAFKFRKIASLGKMGIRTFSTDKKMFYLNFGTHIRWAVMSDNFQAKTRARVIGSRKGSGGPVIRGRGAMTSRGIAPRPGIDPRHFDQEIAKRRQPLFVIRMTKHFKKGLRR